MKWVMEAKELEAVLEKIWDVHDKLSDAILSISRSHFLNSLKSHHPRSTGDPFQKRTPPDAPAAATGDPTNRAGFVYFKDFAVDADDSSAIQEAKSLNAIRTALENLEDQLEFFHTLRTHQPAERDAAIAGLEQSRIILAMRLAEHQGKKYKVIEEAQALVGDVQNASHFISAENSPAAFPTGEKFAAKGKEGSNALANVFLSSFSFVRRFLKLDQMGGILGNSALVAISMLALMQLQQVGMKGKYILDLSDSEVVAYNRNIISRPEGSSGGRSSKLDVLLARG